MLEMDETQSENQMNLTSRVTIIVDLNINIIPILL